MLVQSVEKQGCLAKTGPFDLIPVVHWYTGIMIWPVYLCEVQVMDFAHNYLAPKSAIVLCKFSY
jgi:hypothetical protein